MPTYDYQCSKCAYSGEVYQSFTEEKLKKCPGCKRNSLVRLIGEPNFFVKGEPKTLGHLAEKNSKKFGKDECEEREMKAKERVANARKASGMKERAKAATPWWRDGTIPGLTKSDTPLNDAQLQKNVDELKALGCNVNTNALPPKRDKRKK